MEERKNTREERGGDAPMPRSHAFPCRACGNRMVYSPKEGGLWCSYCGTTEEILSPEIEAAEYEYDAESATVSAPDWEEEGSLTHVCPACGAETLSGAESMTVSCPFCGSHYVTEPHPALPILRPETMVPHKLSREEAAALFSRWARRRYFAPRAFRRMAHNPDMKGVYLPYFTYDTDLDTSFSGQGGRTRVVTYTVRVNGKTQTRTRTVTDWYPVTGKRQEYFDDISFCASRGVDAAMLKKIEPFGTKVLHVYNPAYLSGFTAERYTLGLDEGFARIRPVAEERMQSAIRSSLGYDTYRFMQYNHTYRRVLFKHILLPVWLSSYRYGGRLYRFAVNGESGRVAGESPVSVLKVLLAVLGGLAFLALLVFLFSLTGSAAEPALVPELTETAERALVLSAEGSLVL